MSSDDDYALNLAQKYRVVISISILNTKPSDLSIDEYLDQIRNNINMINTDDELNISACSDDFNIDNDEINQNYMNQNGLKHDSNKISDFNNHTMEINEIIVNETVLNDNITQVNDNITKVNGNRAHVNNNRANFNDNDTQGNGYRSRVNENGSQVISNRTKVNRNRAQVNRNRTNFNDNDTQVNGYANKVDDNTTEVTDNETQDLSNSISLLNSYKEANIEVNVNKERKHMFREIIQIANGVDVKTTLDKVIINENSHPNCNNVYNKPCVDMDLTQWDDDNENIFQSINRLIEDEQSYSQNINANNTIVKIQETKQKDTDINTNIARTTEDINTKHVAKLIKRINITEREVSKPKIAKRNTQNDPKVAADEKTNKNQVTDNIHKESKNSFQVQSNKDTNEIARVTTKDTQEKLMYTSDNTQFDTHYSESQAKEIVIDNKLIYGKPKNMNKNIDGINTTFNSDINLNTFSQNSHKISQTENNMGLAIHTDIMDNFPIRETQARKNAIENEIAFSFDVEMDEAQRPSKNTAENYTTFSQNAHNIDDIDTVKLTNENTMEDSTDFDETTGQIDRNKDCASFDKTDINDSCINNGIPNDIDDVDLTDTERIPYKIIEEMNKIKMYINKGIDRMDYSSGYKSSQSRCSFKSSQPNVRIEQSAYCVFNYISSCCLITTTQELTEQISKILGQLIDRLHEEEIYPQFLEELLRTVDELLKLVYEEENFDLDVLLKKDEQIQRIILLNNSKHIQEYTIGKINIILQQLLDEISADDSTYDIQNINKIENVCYIFHILRVILPKYSSHCSSTQNSHEEEKVFARKNDITDLWRKKWIPNFKETSIEGSFENKCVLKDCSAILNKIIVSSIDGYSLIAFSALQCFNMMQS